MAQTQSEIILDLAQNSDSYNGYCLDCGNIQDQCEPDAMNLKCNECGAFRVCGAEELVLMGYCD